MNRPSPDRRRTRIKICGLTREEDVVLAAELGADALGFVTWKKSPRFVEVGRLAQLLSHVPAFATSVALSVNASRSELEELLAEASPDMLQFHGDEQPSDCAGLSLPYLKATGVRPGLDLLEFRMLWASARALLLDTHSPGYGGSGKVFDWSLIPAELAPRVVLSGGLSAQNVTEAILSVRPYAVDVSSGVEAAPGIKDPMRLQRFFEQVARADTTT
jgi:phosphoribosylanthranilate isomerase